jgi:hypothetical protein
MPDDARLPEGVAALPLKRFSRAEFDQLVAAGMFRECERVELIGGIITSMMGEGFPHADAVDELARALAAICPPHLEVRVRTRLDVGDDSETYPDLLVQVLGTKAAARSPANVVLLAEVSDSSLAHDRKVKAAIYADAGFAEYWVLDLKARRLWVHRHPVDGLWSTVTEHDEIGAAPLFAPDRPVSLADVLPPA